MVSELKPLRIATWNINGLRKQVTRLGSLSSLLQSLEADIICFQETKVRRGDLDRELALAEGWDSYFSSTRGPTGYAGVATFCRRSVTSVVHAEEGFTGTYVDAAAQPASHAAALPLPPGGWPDLTPDQLQALDAEGRCVITDHGAFVLVNVYGPAITSEERAEERAAFKLTFYQALGERLAVLLAAQRPVILLGDLNISPYAIDSCSPSPDFEQSPSRRWLRQQLVEGGGRLLDVFRACHPQQREAYTCWSTATGARVNNYGTRIDLVLAGQPQLTPGGLVTGCPHGCALSHIQQPPLQQQQPQQQQEQEWEGEGHQQQLWQQATCEHVHAVSSDSRGAWATSVPGHPASVQQQQQQHQEEEEGHLSRGPRPHPRDFSNPAVGAFQPTSSSITRSSGSSPLPHHLLEVPVACPCLALWSWVTACDIWAAHQGSDHAPVVLQLTVPAVLLAQGSALPPLSSSNLFKGRQSSLKGWLQPVSAGHTLARAPSGLEQAAANRSQYTQAAGSCSHDSQQQLQQQPQGADAYQGPPSQVDGSDATRSTASQPNSNSRGGPSSIAGKSGGSSQGARLPLAQAAASGSRRGGTGRGKAAGQQTLAGWVSKQGKPPGATPLVTPAGATPAGGLGCYPPHQPLPPPPQQQQQQLLQGLPGTAHKGHQGQQQEQEPAPSSQVGLLPGSHNPAGSYPAQQQLWQPPANTPSTVAAASVAGQQQHSEREGGLAAGGPSDGCGRQGVEGTAQGQSHNQALAAWQRIQQLQAPPKCKGHGVPCKIQTVKKKGPNNGRQFYVCSLPDGPPPVGRCDHFEWCRHRELRGQGCKRPGAAGAGQAHKRPSSAGR